jgi:hypothetical protein
MTANATTTFRNDSPVAKNDLIQKSKSLGPSQHPQRGSGAYDSVAPTFAQILCLGLVRTAMIPLALLIPFIAPPKVHQCPHGPAARLSRLGLRRKSEPCVSPILLFLMPLMLRCPSPVRPLIHELSPRRVTREKSVLAVKR